MTPYLILLTGSLGIFALFVIATVVALKPVGIRSDRGPHGLGSDDWVGE